MRTTLGYASMSLALVLLGGFSATARAQPETEQGQQQPTRGRAMARETRETATVLAIDRGKRMVTLRNDANGERRNVAVPPDVKQFDKLKVGDHIDIDYYESMVVSMMPPGSKPSMSETRSGAAEAGGGWSATRPPSRRR